MKTGVARKALVDRAFNMPVWTAERPSGASGKEWAHLVPGARRIQLHLVVVRFDSECDPLWLVTNLTPSETGAKELGGLYRQR